MSSPLRLPLHGLLAAALLVLSSCARAPAPAEVPGTAAISDPTVQVARSTAGSVSSASIWATEAGARVLAAGGNAADAAVATSFALSVTEPSMSGIGGRASIVIRTAEGETFGIDGLNQVPHGFRDGAPEGYDRAAIPGVPAAMAKLHRDHGTRPLAELLAPAVRLAEEGFALPEDEAGRFAGAAGDLALHPASRAAYLRPDGSPYEAGELFRQPDLARTIRAMAEEGIEVFYHGWIADSIHADMVENGGFITRDEMAGYEALPAIPARGEYRGYGIHANFRPASGHSVVQALQMLEELEVPPRTRGADWAAVVGQAMGMAIGDRNTNPGATDEESARILTSRAHARERAREIRIPAVDGARDGAWLEAAGREGQKAEEGALAGTGGSGGDPVLAGVASGDDGGDWTTHFSVVDGNGNVVSVTQSLGPSMGTRLVARGLGFLYATRLGSEPGSRPSSTIAPTIVLREDGSPWFALGGAGNARIISAVIQVISRVVDHGLPLERAIAEPRVHPGSNGGIFVERGDVGHWSDAQVERLRALGFEPEFQPSRSFGRAHIVAVDGDGFLGVAEPRWTGSSAGPVP